MTDTYYGSSVADGTHTTGNDMAKNATGGTETHVSCSTPLSGSGYTELPSQGVGTSGSASGSLPAQSGKGWWYKIVKAGSIPSGNYSAAFGLANIHASSTYTAFIVRFSYYNSNNSTYTTIGTITVSSQALTTSRATVSFTVTSEGATSFNANDYFYVDLFAQSTTWASMDSIAVYESNSATAGVANDASVTTPSFVRTLDLSTRLRLLSQSTKSIAALFRLAIIKDISSRIRLVPGVAKDLFLRLLLGRPSSHDWVTRLRLFPVAGISGDTYALGMSMQNRCWILPDNSLVLAINASYASSYPAQSVILVQSANWYTANPTWTFVKQLYTINGTFEASIWWDGTRLHTVTAGVEGNNWAMTYLSAAYMHGVWFWDPSPVNVITNALAGSPCITVDSTGTIFVSYTNQTFIPGTVVAYSTQIVARVGGIWQTPFQISSGSSNCCKLLRITRACGKYNGVCHLRDSQWQLLRNCTCRR